MKKILLLFFLSFNLFAAQDDFKQLDLPEFFETLLAQGDVAEFQEFFKSEAGTKIRTQMFSNKSTSIVSGPALPSSESDFFCFFFGDLPFELKEVGELLAKKIKTLRFSFLNTKVIFSVSYYKLVEKSELALLEEESPETQEVLLSPL